MLGNQDLQLQSSHPALVFNFIVMKFMLSVVFGLLVTLGDRYQYVSQAEVCFVGGIAPRFPRLRREIRLVINRNFNPMSSPYAEVVVYIPCTRYTDENGKNRYLPEEIYPPMRKKRETLDADEDAALKCDKILTDLRWIYDGFPSLVDTPFGEYGIDRAFDIEGNEAYIFRTKLCAYMDYAPVQQMTRFSQGNKYGRIKYDSKRLVGTIRNITDGFPVLKGTIFENGIDACFASHKENQAYLFKGENYVRIIFTLCTADDTLVGNVRPIFDGWPLLKGILPLDNRGVDAHPRSGREKPYPDQHDEL
ncbi:hypothetical protein ACSQ67_015947 [Phaseolus vulgaris]